MLIAFCSYFVLKSKKNFSDIPEIPQDPIPKDIERWRKTLDTAIKEVHPTTVHLYKDISDV